MKRLPPPERQAWLEAVELFDTAHDELERLVAEMAREVEEGGHDNGQ